MRFGYDQLPTINDMTFYVRHYVSATDIAPWASGKHSLGKYFFVKYSLRQIMGKLKYPTHHCSGHRKSGHFTPMPYPTDISISSDIGQVR